MQQRVMLFLCFLVGVSVWTLIITQKTKPRIRDERKSDMSMDAGYREDLPPIQISTGLTKAQLLILEISRLKMKLEFLEYNFSYSGVRKLEELLMEYGGTAVRTLIVSTWRSGSSFLGEMVNVMSGNFYHYEPLLRYGITQIRGPPHSNESTQYLKDLFRCDHNAMASYINYWKNNLDLKIFRSFNPIESNRRLWSMCKMKSDICFNSNLVATICKLFPFQSMKVVRFRLKFAKDILEDKECKYSSARRLKKTYWTTEHEMNVTEDFLIEKRDNTSLIYYWLNVKVVLLVRDPRAVMEARFRFVKYCPTPDCMDPEMLCSDMISDYVAAQLLSKKYPNRFMVIRYEELMLNINLVGLQVVKFLRLGPAQSFRTYLKTNGDVGLRITKRSIFKWLKAMDFNSVVKVQDKCKEAMYLWDYELAQNASHMKSKNFYPLQRHNVFPLPLDDDDFDGTFNM